ncbi:alkyl/aryl-sulfatase [Paenibacillus xanthanilyticus]|uniref:Alkyl/aryl-sulfatase n=1 Tax=Paenibacillus xanthanilyticus TaxID=1783531 RepID=A0ABV8K8N7_9BACL
MTNSFLPHHPVPGAASAFTRLANEKALHSPQLRWEETIDFEDAVRGFVAKDAPLIIRRADGTAILDMEQYVELLRSDAAPDTVHPSLWRHAKLNAQAGLFKLSERLYQIRGYDMANMIVIQGDAGYVILDALTSVEASAAAIQLVYNTLGHRPISAVIIGHSHLDHFGGIHGLVEAADVTSGTTRIYAPEGFVEAALSENVLAGPVTRRRGVYQFGFMLPLGPEGLIDGGLGKFSMGGSSSFQYPSDFITYTGEEIVIDGVRFVFQLAPDSEAPASMQAYLPDFKALWVGEIVNHANHNLCPIRGAKPRDAKAWAGYIDEMLQLFPDAELAFGSHFWPVSGKDRVNNWLRKQRDLYKYMHDQTLRLANLGLTPTEIAERIELPESLASEWFNRDYYGAVSLNVKSIYTFYFGWYDGNPANLNPLPPAETAKRLVEVMGGPAAVLTNAQKAYAAGDYQWAVQLLNYIIFAEPTNEEAILLEASAYEQLGFQQESATLRNAYLTAAHELRNRNVNRPVRKNPALYKDMRTEDLLDLLAILLNGPRAAGTVLVLRWSITDAAATYTITVENAVLHVAKLSGPAVDSHADVCIHSTRQAFIQLLFMDQPLDQLLQEDELSISGDLTKLKAFIELLDTFDGQFPIVFP